MHYIANNGSHNIAVCCMLDLVAIVNAEHRHCVTLREFF